jgi:hypothetical protein
MTRDGIEKSTTELRSRVTIRNAIERKRIPHRERHRDPVWGSVMSHERLDPDRKTVASYRTGTHAEPEGIARRKPHLQWTLDDHLVQAVSTELGETCVFRGHKSRPRLRLPARSALSHAE